MGRLKNAMKQARPALRRMGYDVVRWHGHMRSRILDGLSADLVLDVGANVGQYGQELRSSGYSGDILSYEPLTDAYRLLSEAAMRDDRWQVTQTAVGAQRGELEINISGNSFSSSLLPMLKRHADAAPESTYVGTETVRVERLDVLVDRNALAERRPFLKIDTQGYEGFVLDGAEAVLDCIIGLELEMSLVPLYEGQMLMPETIARLADAGFRLAEIFPFFSDPNSGETLQVDGIFTR